MKSIIRILYCCLAILCSITACAPRRISITLATDSSHSPLAGKLVQTWNARIPGMISRVKDSGNAEAAIRMLENGEADMAIVRGEFAVRLPESAPSIVLMESVIQCVTLAGSDITSLAGLRDKRVAVGTRDSSGERHAKRVLESAGITYNDFYPRFLSPEKAQALLEKGDLDALFSSGNLPAGTLPILATNTALVIIPQDTAIEKTLLISRAALDKDTVYKMLKTMYADARQIGILSRQYAD